MTAIAAYSRLLLVYGSSTVLIGFGLCHQGSSPDFAEKHVRDSAFGNIHSYFSISSHSYSDYLISAPGINLQNLNSLSSSPLLTHDSNSKMRSFVGKLSLLACLISSFLIS